MGVVRSDGNGDALSGLGDLGDLLLHLQGVLAPGMTELEAWAEMVKAMSEAGGEPAALHELAVVTTPAGGLGHHIAGRRVIQAGDWIEVDPCGVFQHYHANRNAIFYLGDPPQVGVDLMKVLADAYDVLTTTATVGTPVAGSIRRSISGHRRESADKGPDAGGAALRGVEGIVLGGAHRNAVRLGRRGHRRAHRGVGQHQRGRGPTRRGVIRAGGLR